MSLIEIAIAALIAGMLALTGIAASNMEPVEMASSISRVGMAIAEARSVARANTDEFLSAPGDGATVQFTTDPSTGDTVVGVYWGRPRGEGNVIYELTPERVPMLRIKARVAISILGNEVSPPFAIFISPSGHASAMQGSFQKPLRVDLKENSCLTEIPMAFTVGSEKQYRVLTCEFAALHPLSTAESNAQSLILHSL